MMSFLNEEEKIAYCRLLNTTGWKTIDKLQKGSLSHYTAPNAIYEILSGEKLWFTDYRYLNDSLEGVFIWKIIDKILMNNQYAHKFIESLREIRSTQELKVNRNECVCCGKCKYYVCSFSENPDSLSLWNYYAKTTETAGYNLVFKKRQLINSIKANNTFKEADYYLIRVIYKESDQIKCLKPIVDFFHQMWMKYKTIKRAFIIADLYDLLQRLALGFKHVAYENEKEVRLVIVVPEEDDQFFYENIDDLNIRVKGNYFIPYLSLSIDKNALDNIVASPYIKDQAALDSLKLFTKKIGLHHCNIIPSNIPARF